MAYPSSVTSKFLRETFSCVTSGCRFMEAKLHVIQHIIEKCKILSRLYKLLF